MKSKFIGFIVVIIVLVIGVGIFMNKATSGPSKYDGLAQELKAQGAEFFGAFWCPHCLAEKTLFGNAKKYLPYIECSNPDQTPTQICLDNKIESYPSWRFKNGITLTSKTFPTICDIQGTPNESAVCAKAASKFYKTWFFPEYKFSVKSPTAPENNGETWKFPHEAMTQGEIPLEFLAQQINYSLPQ